MEKKKEFIVNIVFYLMIGGLLIGLCHYILPVLIPFFVAFFVAGILQYLARKICGNFVHRKKICAVLLVIVFYAIFFLIVIGLGTNMIVAAVNLVKSFPELYKSEILPLLNQLSDKLEIALRSMDINLSQKIENVFQEIIQNLGQYISKFSMNFVKLISEKVTGIPAFIVKLIITIVATFFMAADFDKMITFLKKLLPKEKEDSAQKVIHYVKDIIFIYIKSYSLLFFLTFIELVIGLLLLRIPNAVIVAIFIAVFDILPVLGTGGILLPWAVVMFAMGDIPMTIGILILYIVITAIRNTLEPKIVGRQIGLHPLVTLIAMVIGLKLLGIIGLICFPVGLSIFVNLEKCGVIHFKKKQESI